MSMGDAANAGAAMFAWKGVQMVIFGGEQTTTGKETKEQRYAPYVEGHHHEFLNEVEGIRQDIIEDSPYVGYDGVDTDAVYFSAGMTIGLFSSLYEVYGKHMASLDLDSVWNYALSETVNRDEIQEKAAKEIIQVNDALINEELPNFQAEMRGINAVNTSSFVVGKSIIEGNRVKELCRINRDALGEELPGAYTRFLETLGWNKNVVVEYAKAMKDYFSSRAKADDLELSYAVKDRLWPFEVLDFERATLAALQGPISWDKSMEKMPRSPLSRSLLIGSYAWSGMMVGSAIYPGVGTIVGAVVGFVIGVAIVMLE